MTDVSPSVRVPPALHSSRTRCTGEGLRAALRLMSAARSRDSARPCPVTAIASADSRVSACAPPHRSKS